LDELDEPEAKASLIWIIGEYANSIDNAGDLLSIFVDTFIEEAYPVSAFLYAVILSYRITGSITNSDSRRQTLPSKTRLITRIGPESTQHRDQGLRFSRR